MWKLSRIFWFLIFWSPVGGMILKKLVFKIHSSKLDKNANRFAQTRTMFKHNRKSITLFNARDVESEPAHSSINAEGSINTAGSISTSCWISTSQQANVHILAQFPNGKNIFLSELFSSRFSPLKIRVATQLEGGGAKGLSPRPLIKYHFGGLVDFLLNDRYLAGVLGYGFETQNKYKIKNSLGQVIKRTLV